MNIKELNAGIQAFGKVQSTLFGSTILIYGHTVTLHENGSVNVDYSKVGSVKDDPFDLITSIVKVAS